MITVIPSEIGRLFSAGVSNGNAKDSLVDARATGEFTSTFIS